MWSTKGTLQEVFHVVQETCPLSRIYMFSAKKNTLQEVFRVAQETRYTEDLCVEYRDTSTELDLMCFQ